MVIAYVTDIDELDGKPVVALRQSEAESSGAELLDSEGDRRPEGRAVPERREVLPARLHHPPSHRLHRDNRRQIVRALPQARGGQGVHEGTLPRASLHRERPPPHRQQVPAPEGGLAPEAERRSERLRRIPLRRFPQPAPQGDQGGSRPREQAASQGQGRPPAHGQGEPGMGLPAVHRVHQREGGRRLPQDQARQEVQPHLRAHQGRHPPVHAQPRRPGRPARPPRLLRDPRLPARGLGRIPPLRRDRSLLAAWRGQVALLRLGLREAQGEEAGRHEEQLDHRAVRGLL